MSRLHGCEGGAFARRDFARFADAFFPRFARASAPFFLLFFLVMITEFQASIDFLFWFGELNISGQNKVFIIPDGNRN